MSAPKPRKTTPKEGEDQGVVDDVLDQLEELRNGTSKGQKPRKQHGQPGVKRVLLVKGQPPTESKEKEGSAAKVTRRSTEETDKAELLPVTFPELESSYAHRLRSKWLPVLEPETHPGK